MLTKLRNQTKAIMWIVAIAFVLTIVFAWGMDYSGGSASPVLGRVNKQKIMIQEFQNALQANFQYQREQSGGRDLNESMVEYIREQTWQQMVDQILVNQELQRLGLTTSDQEVVFVLQHNPPSVMRQIPDFQTDGVFDPQKYQAAMRNFQYADFWVSIEQQLRSFLPQVKLEHIISAIPVVSDAQARASYIFTNEKVAVDFVRVDPTTHPDTTVTVTFQEIESYYNNHQEEYTQPPKVDLNYVLLYKNASERDRVEIQQTLLEIRERLEEGEDFNYLAQQYSDDPSATEGGYLGWVGRGEMVSAFEDAGFELDQKSISDPVRTEFGWHIIQCDSIRDAGTDNEERELRHILLRDEASSTTLDSLENLLTQLQTMAEDDDFTTAAMQLGLEVQQTGPVTRGGFVPGIGFEQSVTNFAFANRIGTISDIMEHESAYYMVQVRDKIEEGVTPLTEVSDQIREDLLYVKQLEALESFATDLAAQIRTAPLRLNAIAEAESLTVTDTQTFSRDDYVTGVGRDPAFIAAAFTTPIGGVAGPIRGENEWYILYVKEHLEVEETGLDAIIAGERDRLLRQQITNAFNEWVRGLRAQANIVDNRYRFFY